MANYKDLLLDTRYLIKEFEGDSILLVEPIMISNECCLILIHDDVDSIVWKKQSDEILEIIEEFTAAQSNEYDEMFVVDEDIESEEFDD
jgi:hypothetical protein